MDNRSGFRLATQTRARLILEQVRVKYCSRNAWLEQRSSFKLVFKHVSQPLLTGVDSKPQVQMERMSYWHNFIKKGELLLFCLLPALWKLIRIEKAFEPPHDKTNKMTYATSEDSDQPGIPPSLIRVFAVHSMGSWGPNVSSCGHRRLIRLGGCPGWSESSLGAFL